MIAQSLVLVNALTLGASLQSSSDQATVARHATPWDARSELLRYQSKRGHVHGSTSELLGASADLSNEFLVVDPPEMLNFRKEIVDIDDLFSASWMMNLSLFMRVDITDVKTVEDGCFGPFRQANRWGYPVGQTRDWFDFSVEHLSHYWRAAGVCMDRAAHDIFMGHMNNYISNVKMVEPPPLQDTIGILAFQPYGCSCPVAPGETPCSGEELTTTVLTATLKSLQRAGLGRVIVVSTIDTAPYEPRNESFGNTHVVFIKIDPATTKTEFIENNLPHGAIANLQEAVRNKDEKWLGKTPGRWRSVMLTEPDMITHIKENSINDLAKAVEAGFTISPHRLQPVPHPSDAKEVENSISRGSPSFKVQSVENPDAKCIDVGGDFQSSHPGRVDMCRDHPEMQGCCQDWWWHCGFANSGNHTRLDQYTMMRLGFGTGVTVLSADEHARKCILQK